MYLSEMDLLKARLTAEGRLSQSRILQEILREDSQSEQKRKMREGERYYRCDHDILRKDFRRTTISETKNGAEELKTSVYKGYKQDKIEMRGDRAEMSDFPLYLNTVAGGLDRRDQTIGGFSFVVKIYAVPVIEIIG